MKDLAPINRWNANTAIRLLDRRIINPIVGSVGIWIYIARFVMFPISEKRNTAVSIACSGKEMP